MKLLAKTCILLILSISVAGCQTLDYDTMVCQKENNRVSYEIAYENDDIRYISVVEKIILAENSVEELEEALATYQTTSEERSKNKGVSESASLEGSEIIIRTQIDHEKYDYISDELGIIPVRLEEANFNGVQTLRMFFVNEAYTCDEQVDY